MHFVKSRIHGALIALVLTPAASGVDAQAEVSTEPAPAAPGAPPNDTASTTAPEAAAVTPTQPNASSPSEGTLPEETFTEPSPLELGLQTTQEDLQGVRTDLENFKFQWQRERDLHTAITTRYLKIGGVVQARFGWLDRPTNSAISRDAKTTFDINSAILSFTGTLYRDYEEGRNLTYNLRFGVSKQTNTNNSFLNLLDAQIVYNFLPTINPEDPTLTATVGQQQLPFGLEVSATEELRPVVRNALFATAGLGGPAATLNLARRDVGLIFRGELFPLVDFGYNYRVPILSYALGVVDGAGPNVLDDNNFKDIIARLAFTVPTDFNSWLRQFTVGGTAYIGRTNTFLKDKEKTLVGTGHSHRYGLDVYYNHWPFGITYEYILADDYLAHGTSREAPNRKNLRRDSHTATFFLSFGEQFVSGFRNQGRFDDWWPKTYQPFLRYDRFDTDKQTGKNHVQVYTAGFNLFLAETTKVQFNYNLTDVAANQDRFLHEVLMQAQFGF